MVLPKTFSDIGKSFLFSCLLLLLTFFFTLPIGFITADLGRHLKNGEIFFERHRPISTNFYSFTQPDFPTINHHWLTGVIFLLIHRVGGFEGISVFYTMIFLLSFYFFFDVARRSSNFYYALFFALISFPLIVSRREIRPEGLTCLFVGLYFWLFYKFKRKEIKFEWLWIIPLCQVVWVNIHILFMLGIIMVGMFVVDVWLNESEWPIKKKCALLGIITVLVCFLNPFGLKGFLTPLTILKEYGYMIAENQSVPFMCKRFPNNPLYFQFITRFVICLISFILAVLFMYKRKYRSAHSLKKKFSILPDGWTVLKGNVWEIGIFMCFGILAWKAVRSIQMFGLFFIPLTAGNLYSFLNPLWPKFKPTFNKSFLFFSILLFIPPVLNLKHSLPNNPLKIFGLAPKVNGSAEFFKRNKLEGPIFNNYDIGGYLIYHLFPQERVFVDNRPEAYTVSFFKDIYVPMQEDELVWKKIDQQYHFNVIYFFRLDMTPWAQPFLLKRLRDPFWAPVFVDDYTIIFLKRNEKNAPVIERHELPKSMFKMEGEI